MKKIRLNVDDKVKFKSERLRYTVQAADDRFAICTKPFNPMNTVLYSVIDFKEKVRGTENLVFGMGAETREQCQEMLERLQKGESEVSYRTRIKLDIERIDRTDDFSGKLLAQKGKVSKELNLEL